MIPSPFHGIFSSSINAGGEFLMPKKQQKTEAPQRPAIQAPPQRVPVVGQIRSAAVGQVALDIFEYDNYYILKAPIAGVRLADLDIEITDNILTIRGQRRQTEEIPDSQYYVRECFWGEFERSVTLPFNIDPRKVKATFNKECILKILVPKEERVKIIRINE
ncbi:MAG: Hsp20/alpha crystallin family protein [Candidatus Peribacteraceae bacterium]